MNARTALCMALLEGRVLNVSNCFREVGLTNIGRELPRMIEVPFGIEISRTPKVGKNRYGSPVSYTNYRLNRTLYNQPGLVKMEEYIIANGGSLGKQVPVGRPRTIDQPEVIEPPKQKQQTLF